jgi:hypothetical protein
MSQSLAIMCFYFVFVSVLIQVTDSTSAFDTKLLARDVYTQVFRLSDGSHLANTDTAAVNSMLDNVHRLLACRPGDDVIGILRNNSDGDILRTLFLSVAGNFAVEQSSSALPQRCALVVDPGTGSLMFRDSSTTRSVIIEVLLVVSIVCLLRAWGGGGT